MTPEQAALARELAAHPRFDRFTPGLRIVSGTTPGEVWRADDWLSGEGHERFVTSMEGDQYSDYDPPADLLVAGVPDLTDAATGGVLWEMAGRPEVFPGTKILVREVGQTEPWHKGATLAEACARALLAGWNGGPS